MRNSMAGMQAPQEMMRRSVQAGYYSGCGQAAASQSTQSCYSCTSQDSSQDLQKDHCECVPQETCIDYVLLAQAYVPFQKFCGTWPPLRSLLAGTIFPELYSPYRKREYVNLEPEVTCGMCPAGGGCY